MPASQAFNHLHELAVHETEADAKKVAKETQKESREGKKLQPNMASENNQDFSERKNHPSQKGESGKETKGENERKERSKKKETKSRTKSKSRSNEKDKTTTGGESAQARSDARKQNSKTEKVYRPSRWQRRQNLEFTRQFGAAVDRIFPERQTRERLTKLAHLMGSQYGADKETLGRTLSEMRPGAERSFVHVESPRPFPKSQISPLKWMRVSKFAIGDKPRKWGDIMWKKNLIIGELRIQKSRLCARAPKWSPLHDMEIPALRFSSNKSKSSHSQPSEIAKQRAAQQQKTRNKDNSQSH